MSAVTALSDDRMSPAMHGTADPSGLRPGIEAAIAAACDRIAPLWPLKNFVAVNPFLGFTGRSFEETCATMRRVVGADMLMPRAFYREALASGVIEDQDLEEALAAAPLEWIVPPSVAALRQTLDREPAGTAEPGASVTTVADMLDRLAAGDRQASRTAFMIDEISRWCAAYFDEGQAIWRLPFRDLGLYAAWRAAMCHDRNPEMMGIKGFRAAVERMPDDPVEAIVQVVEALGIPEGAVEDYLHRALFDIGGWAAYVRHLVWNGALQGRSDDTLVQLLAVRVVWGHALFLERRDAAFGQAWRDAMTAAASPVEQGPGCDAGLAVGLIMQQAYERAYQRRLLARLGSAPPAPQPKDAAARAPLQAAFCIDVRSEVYRRALETICPGAGTVGFAGFFGFPMEYVPIGARSGGARCPVLLKPALVVCEGVDGASQEEERKVAGLRLLRRRVAGAWKAFKLSAVSSFTYVETAGLLFAGKIVSDSLGLTRTVPDPDTSGIDRKVAGRVRPRIGERVVGDRRTGFDGEQRVAMAEAVLRAMSATGNFARLFLLAGHGSSTVNNPHASGLDCGACGGHAGEANARVAAAILNDPDVRTGLKARGIGIPEDTWFLACLHDTTTDEVEIFDEHEAPASHAAEIGRLKAWLAEASSLARMERAALLGVPADEAETAVPARSRDWSQVRPEWGLAGNAAFIAAPRARTAGIDLGGRAFLHDYDWRLDADGKVLELIMTAPMVVASWINLQYYGSTVDNLAFGAGNKVLHNVTGAIGVIEGNAGDLKVGLPWQSVHDGRRFVHEPLRLSVIIAAPVEALNGVIAGHRGVRDLVDNGWVHLFAMADGGRVSHRYRGGFDWEELPSPAAGDIRPRGRGPSNGTGNAAQSELRERSMPCP
jgi:uncharacterized protein